MAHNARDVDAALRRKGFVVREQKRYRRYFFYTRDGSRSGVSTSMSRGSRRGIGRRLAGFMASDCKLTNRELDRLIDCSMSREDYEELLVEGGWV